MDAKDNADFKDKLVQKLIRKQKKDTHTDLKLTFRDIKRICKNINTDPFDKKQCCLWTGKIANMNNQGKGVYINFYFKGKKQALHRLLYSNFIGSLSSDEYLKYRCDNKGVCCNIRHFDKYRYSSSDDEIIRNNRVEKLTNELVVERRNDRKNGKLVLNFE